ncbi:hypothetical protein O181_111036 [Austropuccinia psidii MF-1]|uniref:Uncharacterized protein n=1 Tax=Austropuccinia psidii MF-1 TaxID=1389203 RepID=A0A9Q3JZR2_9BASI|nr:hypothetical protein [Austropuccinia psidii MF-1]
MESWPLLEENSWSLDTEMSWIEENKVWSTYNYLQESNENPDWFLKMKPEPCPDISTIVLPYIEFEDIFEKENSPLETVISHPLKKSPGFNLTKYEFLELITWDGVEGNLGNQHWNKAFEMDEHLRKSLFWRTWECQDLFNLQDFQIKNGTIRKIPENYIVKNATWDCHWAEALIPAILRIKNDRTKMGTEDCNYFCQECLFCVPVRYV